MADCPPRRPSRPRLTGARLRLCGLALVALAVAAAPPDPPATSPLHLDVQLPDFGMETLARAVAPGQRPLVLALGGGAAKGIAHAGVLQRLQEEGLPVAAVAGTSMGAFMGSMYATGFSGYSIQALLEKVDVGAILLDRQHRFVGETLWEQENQRSTFLSLEYEPGVGLAFSPGTSPGLDLKRVLQVLLSRGSLRANSSFDHLRMPFRAVCTNLQLAKAAAPTQGELATVVRASMSIPGMFSPVLLNGHQHVDGMLVQNLPVETARALQPQAIVLAVEVGGSLDAGRQNSILGLAFRALDVSIEERTELSRRAADLVLRPRTDTLPYLEFHHQVQAAVQAGRDAFDQNLDRLEALLYGPEGALPAAGGELRIQAPEALQAPLRALAQAALPAGPRLRRHYLRLLRRIQAQGLAAQAELRFPADGPVLVAQAHPLLRRIEFRGARIWSIMLAPLLSQAGLAVGQPFNPAALARALDQFSLQATLTGRVMVSAEGSGFDPDSGLLHLDLDEPVPTDVHVQAGLLAPAQTAYLTELLSPFGGHAVEARPFMATLQLAEKRLGLKELRITADPEASRPSILAVPVPDNRIILEGVMAYESAWGTHAAVTARTSRLFNRDLGFGLHASANHLRTLVELETSRNFRSWPRSGWSLAASQTTLSFPSTTYATTPALGAEMTGVDTRALRQRQLSAGLFTRIGAQDRALLTLELSRKWDRLQPGQPGPGLPTLDQVQGSAEWDDFDRYLFPTEGTLVRVKAGQGTRFSPEPGVNGAGYQFSYGRVRHLWPLGSWASLEADLELGLGWNLPWAQSYSAGGPAFLAGSTSSEFFTANFGLARIGLPLRVASLFGVNLQVVPRFDYGYLGGAAPRDLRDRPALRGLGLTLRSELGRWYGELAVGRWLAAEAGPVEKTRVNILLGAHPFDLWRDH